MEDEDARRPSEHSADKDGTSAYPGTAQQRRSITIAQKSLHEEANHAVHDKPKSTLVDVTAMKEKVRQNLCKPVYRVSDFYWDTGIAQAIARSNVFDKFTLAVIGINALWIAIDTDWNDAAVLIQADPVFIVAENFFCAYFAFEWTARFCSFRKKRTSLQDAWFVFDSFMVGMMVLETWVFTLVLLLVLDPDAAAGGNTGIMRLARLLRLSRMARMAKLLRVMPELMIMIKGMKAATRSVFFTLLLLAVIMYVFGIAFVQLSTDKGNDFEVKYFRNVPSAMYTLLMHGILLDNVGILTIPLQDEPVLFVMFMAFVLIGALTVMNMLVGVLCEVVSAVAATEQEEMLVSHVNDRLSRVMALLDSDGGGTISKQEFIQILDNVEAVRCLSDVGVDVFALIDLADYIFEDDDANSHEEQELDFQKFMEVVLNLRGTNVATVKDIIDLRKFMRMSLLENHKQTTKIMEKLELLSASSIGGGDAFTKTKSMDSNCSAIKMTPDPHSYQNGNDRIIDYGHEAKQYKVEDGNSPILPKHTPTGQLLNLIPILAEEPPGFKQLGENVNVKGNWAPLPLDATIVTGSVDAPKELMDLSNSYMETCHADHPGLDASKVQDSRLGLDRRNGYSAKTLVIPMGNLPSLRIECTGGKVDDKELESLQRHVETMFRQLAEGLNSTFALASKRNGAV